MMLYHTPHMSLMNYGKRVLRQQKFGRKKEPNNVLTKVNMAVGMASMDNHPVSPRVLYVPRSVYDLLTTNTKE